MNQQNYKRRFRLIKELEQSEKNKDPSISYGPKDQNDRSLSLWQALIYTKTKENQD